MHATIFSKMELKQLELDKLRASEHSIKLEQSQRKDRKKLTVFWGSVAWINVGQMVGMSFCIS